jgi:L-threonylcarbamoyladenylate synthase
MTETICYPASEPGSIAAVAAILREGGLAAIPTDTLYGLAASVLSPEAMAGVFTAKRRPPDARVPVLIATAADLPLLAANVPRDAWRLIDRFWPGAVTLVFPARRSLPEVLTRGGQTVAVRVPAARSALRLLEALGEPVVGTSANLSGSPAATTAQEVLAQLGGRIDAVLEDDAAVSAGAPSTIVDLSGEAPVIVRAGAVPADAIREALGTRVNVQEHLTVRQNRG